MIAVHEIKYRNFVCDQICIDNVKRILENASYSDSDKISEILNQIKVTDEMKKEYRERFYR